MTTEILIFALHDLTTEQGYKATVMGPRSETPFMLVTGNYQTLMVGIKDGQFFVELDYSAQHRLSRIFFDLADPGSLTKVLDSIRAGIALKNAVSGPWSWE